MFKITLGLVGALVALGIAGCSAGSEDAATAAAAADAPFSVREGLYPSSAAPEIQEDTCGLLSNGVAQEFVAQATAAGYTRTVAWDHTMTSSSTPAPASFPETFIGHTARYSNTQVQELAMPTGDAKLTVAMDTSDTWSGDASFIRSQTEAWTCEGDGCTELQGLLMHGSMPCHTSQVVRRALASCAHYPFRYVRPDATSVWISGTFNHWAKTPAEGALVMTKDATGVWALTAHLPAGPHQYKFITDGADVFDTDMANPLTADDGVGGFNSIADCK